MQDERGATDVGVGVGGGVGRLIRSLLAKTKNIFGASCLAIATVIYAPKLSADDSAVRWIRAFS